MKREAVTEAERVFHLASSLLAESPEMNAPQAIELALLFVALLDQTEVLRYYRELLKESE